MKINGWQKKNMDQFTPMEFRDLAPGDHFYFIKRLLISKEVDLMQKTHDGLYTDPKGETHAIWNTSAHVYGPVLRANENHPS